MLLIDANSLGPGFPAANRLSSSRFQKKDRVRRHFRLLLTGPLNLQGSGGAFPFPCDIHRFTRWVIGGEPAVLWPCGWLPVLGSCGSMVVSGDLGIAPVQ